MLTGSGFTEAVDDILSVWRNTYINRSTHTHTHTRKHTHTHTQTHTHANTTANLVNQYYPLTDEHVVK